MVRKMSKLPPDAPSQATRDTALKMGKNICSFLGLDARDVYELHLEITTSGYSGFVMLFERKAGHLFKGANGEVAMVRLELPLWETLRLNG